MMNILSYEVSTERGQGHVRGMLCFVEGDWPLLGGSFPVEGLDVLWPKKARKIITAPGAVGDDRLRVLPRYLAAELPPA